MEGEKEGGAGREEGDSGEIEALRGIILAELRRRPGDVGSVMRSAEVLFRMMASQKRMSPKSKRDLALSLATVLNSFGPLIHPPDEG